MGELRRDRIDELAPADVRTAAPWAIRPVPRRSAAAPKIARDGSIIFNDTEGEQPE